MDTPLLTQIAAGRPGAVEDFLRHYGNSVWGLARRFCRSAEDAEDATQEILVEIWRNAVRYDQNAGSELTFVMTIARRRLIDRARRLGRLRATAQDLAQLAGGAAGTSADRCGGRRPGGTRGNAVAGAIRRAGGRTRDVNTRSFAAPVPGDL